jgi:hypothetical protein
LVMEDKFAVTFFQLSAGLRAFLTNYHEKYKSLTAFQCIMLAHILLVIQHYFKPSYQPIPPETTESTRKKVSVTQIQNSGEFEKLKLLTRKSETELGTYLQGRSIQRCDGNTAKNASFS